MGNGLWSDIIALEEKMAMPIITIGKIFMDVAGRKKPRLRSRPGVGVTRVISPRTTPTARN